MINKLISVINKIPGVNIGSVSEVALTEESKAAQIGATEAAATSGGIGGFAYPGLAGGASPYQAPQQQANQTSNQNVSINVTGNSFDSDERQQSVIRDIETKFSRQMQVQRFGATV